MICANCKAVTPFLSFKYLKNICCPIKICSYIQCRFSSDKDTSSDSNNELDSPKQRYRIFRDEDSPIILDVTEEKLIYQKEKAAGLEYKRDIQPAYIRGLTGVFDVEELVELLKKDNAKDIFVVEVSKELKYVDYLVIVTGRSRRHLLGLAEYVREIFKKKRHPGDHIPQIEGENSSEWIAMDLGNIALHIMSSAAREIYDLESLWSLGAKFDSMLQLEEDDTILQIFKKHSISLDDIQPLKGG